MASLRAAKDRIIVKEPVTADTSPGGIYLPFKVDGEKTPAARGTVVSVYEDKGRSGPSPYRVGQELIFSSYAGTLVKVDGVEHRILQEIEVLAIVVDS